MPIDRGHPRILELAAEVQDTGAGTGRDPLITAHRLIAARVRPMYAMNGAQPASGVTRARRGCGGGVVIRRPGRGGRRR